MPSEELGRREELLRRSIDVFSSRGYRATSMKDLADEVSLGKSTLYHYFKSKQEILIAIYTEVISDNIKAAQEIAGSSQSVVDSLRQMLADRVSYTCENHQILQIFHEEEAELPKRLMTRVQQSRRAYQKVMTDVLEEGASTGYFELSTTPMIVANVLLGACNWSYKWYDPAGSKTPKELGVEISELLLRAILSRR